MDLELYSLFETTIRYVAASLTTYELSGQQYPALVNQAKVLVDRMTNAFVGVSSFVHSKGRRLIPNRESEQLDPIRLLVLEQRHSRRTNDKHCGSGNRECSVTCSEL